MDYNYNDYELVYLIKESNEDALGIIIKKYDPIIRSLAFSYARKYSDLYLDVDDLIQEGRISLCRSLNDYDETTLFYTFVVFCIKRAMNNFVRNRNRRNFVLYNDYVNDDYEFEIPGDNRNVPSKLVEDFDDINIVKDFKNTLSDFESAVFDLKWSGFKYSEIASLLDVNLKKVDNEMVKIKTKLKKYLLSVK